MKNKPFYIISCISTNNIIQIKRDILRFKVDLLTFTDHSLTSVPTVSLLLHLSNVLTGLEVYNLNGCIPSAAFNFADQSHQQMLLAKATLTMFRERDFQDGISCVYVL